jgi:hypothetical protein
VLRRLAAIALLSVAALFLARTAPAATFYVSPAGSDSASGSLTSPWRTVSRVNRSTAGPGDTVLFAAGAVFSDATLMPRRSGAAGSPIVFRSFGNGQATLTKGAWLDGNSFLTFDSLTVDAAGAAASAGVSTATAGAGSSSVTITNCRFLRVEIGISMANRGDNGWRVQNTLIQHTADSGVITLGRDSTFAGNTILDTGENAAITYGKHGIYAKGPGLTLTGNTIRRFSANGISLRYRNAVARGNTISDGPIGIGWFQNDTVAGTTTIADNTITGTRSSGVYVSPSDNGGATRESFVITGNTVVGASGNGMDINATSGSLVLTFNKLSGAISPALAVKRPAGAFEMHDNVVGARAPASRVAARVRP